MLLREKYPRKFTLSEILYFYLDWWKEYRDYDKPPTYGNYYNKEIVDRFNVYRHKITLSKFTIVGWKNEELYISTVTLEEFEKTLSLIILQGH